MALQRATEIRGIVTHGDNGEPRGVAWGSVERYVTTGLREYDWPLTKVSLRVAQLRSAAQERADRERLWTERNG